MERGKKQEGLRWPCMKREMLEKELVLPDEQNDVTTRTRPEPIRTPAAFQKSRNEVATHPVPAIALSL
jgi:hypothetical protein